MNGMNFKAGQTWTVKVLATEDGGISQEWELIPPAMPAQPSLKMPLRRIEPPPEYRNTAHVQTMARGAFIWERYGYIHHHRFSRDELSELENRMDQNAELIAMMSRHGQRAYQTTKIGYGALGAAYLEMASHDEDLTRRFFEEMLGTVREKNENAPIPRWIKEGKIGPFEYPWRSAVLTLLEFYDVFVAERGNLQERHIEGVLQRVKEKM